MRRFAAIPQRDQKKRDTGLVKPENTCTMYLFQDHEIDSLRGGLSVLLVAGAQ
jgi:hypothetical protein